MNCTDCAVWFCEIREENAAVPGRSSSGGRVLSADRSGDRRGFLKKRSENRTRKMYRLIRDRSLLSAVNFVSCCESLLVTGGEYSALSYHPFVNN